MKRALLFTLLFLLIPFFHLSPEALALKKRVRAPKIPGVAYSSVRLSRPTNSVVFTLLNLKTTKNQNDLGL